MVKTHLIISWNGVIIPERPMTNHWPQQSLQFLLFWDNLSTEGAAAAQLEGKMILQQLSVS